MKKLKYIVLILAAAISTAACNKEITEINGAGFAKANNGKLTVSAIAGTVGNGDADTKAHGDYGYDILWDENDEIAVKDASGHQGIFGIADGVGKKVGTFAQSESDTYEYSGEVTGYYPAEMLQEDGSIKWPTAQKYSKVLTDVPMTATATITDGGTVFNFDGLGGVLQLILTVPGVDLPMKSITVSADNLNEPISLDCIGLTLGAAAQTVNISLPAQEYTNMKLSFEASNGTLKDLTAKKGITIKKNVVLKGAYALDGFELKNVPDYLYFTAVDGSVSIGMQNYGTVETIGFEYTTDPVSGTWEDFTADNSVYTVQNMITLDAGETVFIRAKALRTGLSISDSNYWNFVFSGDTNGRVRAGGNIMSLIDPEVKSTTVGSYAFCHLFDATFCQSKLLLTSPKILTNTLAEHCFDRMFNECRALQEPPMLLPAMKLAESCYEYMFSGCSALKYAPALPASQLAKECYYGMFNRCTNITESPYLPASTLSEGCYQNMFYGCSSLSSVNVNFTDFNAVTDATTNWLYGVSSTGMFYCPQDVAPEFLGSSGAVPAGWRACINVLPDNAAIGTEVYSNGRPGIYVGTVGGHKLLFAKTDIGSDSEYTPGTRFSREELASLSWEQGWRLPTEAEMLALYQNFTLSKFEDAAWFSFNATSTSLLFPYTNNVSEDRRESRSWLSGGESFFWFRSDNKCGKTGDTSEIADRRYTVRLVKEL